VKLHRHNLFEIVVLSETLCFSVRVGDLPTPQKVTDHIGKVYTLKKGSVGEPTTYLGADIGKYYLPDAPTKVRWSMSADKYLKRAVKEVELQLGAIDRKLITRALTPFAIGYRPEMDVTPELNAEQHNYFQGLIGVLR
jgi:hypothetical protein